MTQLRSGPKPSISPSSINKLPSLTHVINTMNAAAITAAAVTTASSSSSSSSSSSGASTSYSMSNLSNQSINRNKTSPDISQNQQKIKSNTNLEVIQFLYLKLGIRNV